MPEFKTPNDLLEYIAQLRRDHASTRAEVATRIALGLNYANGRQWTQVTPYPQSNEIITDTWDEDWDPHSHEIRVVDNRIGPLTRRIASETNATRIESQVTPPRHARTFEAVDQAVVSQSILNALSDDMGMTRVARNASSLRWVTGCSIIQIKLASKKRKIPADVLRGRGGVPVEINDQWVRWDFCPLSDLIWDPTIIAPDLVDHSELVLERVYTLKQFKQEYGDPSAYGIDPKTLPRLEEIAPHHIAAAGLGGTAYYETFARNRDAPGLRVITAYFADPRDPGRWPVQYVIFDIGAEHDTGRVDGLVSNFKNPASPFGGHGLPLFKLDAFRRDDAVLPHGAPHVMMADQDRLNLLKSTEFQQLLNVVHGMWLVDTRAADRDQFLGDLNSGVGGVLRWDSQGGQNQPPQFVHPPPPNQVWVPLEAAEVMGMREQVHLSQLQFGQAKTHVPKDFQQRMLQESNSVVDNVIIRDVDCYSDALKVTLGSIRKSMDQPSRMIARLRDQHGLTPEDLQAFLSLDAAYVPLTVRVRTHSIISRSVQERTQELLGSAKMGLITPRQAVIAMAEELERPIIQSHDTMLQFCHRSVRQIVAGAPWPGMPNLDPEMFQHTAEKAMFALDILKPADRQAIHRLEEAILIQKQLALENTVPPQGAGVDRQGAGGIQSPANNTRTPGPPPGGAPESINPMTSPVGAAGGLPLGLPPA